VSKGNHNTPNAASGGDLVLLPRVVRLRDAPGYLGMDRNRFNAEVRPYVTEIRLGKQGVAFDRLELDAWFDEYKSCNGRPGQSPKGERLWDEKELRVSSKGPVSGTSTNRSTGGDFARALEQVASKKQNVS
jgi:hypothetical protein